MGDAEFSEWLDLHARPVAASPTGASEEGAALGCAGLLKAKVSSPRFDLRRVIGHKSFVGLLIESEVSVGSEGVFDDMDDPVQHFVEAKQFEEQLRLVAGLCLGKSKVNPYAELAHELTTFSEADRRFRPSPNVSFTPKTCFVITEAGVEFLHGIQEEASLPVSTIPMPKLAVVADPVPHWDRRMRTLYLGDCIVKRYRQPARNQETVLLAFEEEAWRTLSTTPSRPSITSRLPKCGSGTPSAA